MKFPSAIKGSQTGSVLIEVMVAALLFIVGLMGLVGVSGKSVVTQSDIQYRTEATKHASEMIDTMWLNVDRSSPAATSASLLTFQHLPGGGNCNFNGAASGNAMVTAWVNKIRNGAIIPPAVIADPATRLPGSSASTQQIVFNAANNNEVTVRVCWRSSNDEVARQHVMRAYIN